MLVYKNRRSQNRSRENNFASAAKNTYRYAGNILSGLTKWATTDHYGTAHSILNMPQMGFKNTCIFILIRLLIGLAGVMLSGILAVTLIMVILPALLSALFS